MSFSEAEARIRRLMSRMSDDELRLSVVQDRILRTRQDLAGFYQVGAGQVVVTFKGEIRGCTNLPLPDATIRLVGYDSGIDYGTFSSADGKFEVSIALDPSDTQYNLYWGGPGPRFGSSGPLTFGLSVGIPNLFPAQNAPPATGYACMTQFAYPVSKALKLEDSVYGTIDFPWSSFVSPPGSAQWVTTVPISAIGGGGCSAASTLVTYQTFPNATPAPSLELLLGWPCVHSTFDLCPNLVGPGYVRPYAAPNLKVITSSPGPATKLDVSWPVAPLPSAGSLLYGGGTATIRIYEP